MREFSIVLWTLFLLAIMILLVTIQEKSRMEQCKSMCMHYPAHFVSQGAGKCYCQVGSEITLKKEW